MWFKNKYFNLEKKIFNFIIGKILGIKFGRKIQSSHEFNDYIVVSFAKLMRSLFFIKRHLRKNGSNLRSCGFYDIGFGEADTLYFVSKFYDFSNIGGVEVDSALVNIAKNKYPNLENLTCDNALNISYTVHNESIFYFYNPMPFSILEKVVERIASQSKKCIFLFINIDEIKIFLNDNRFNQIYSESAPSNVYCFQYENDNID